MGNVFDPRTQPVPRVLPVVPRVQPPSGRGNDAHGLEKLVPERIVDALIADYDLEANNRPNQWP
jgi:hypothetical protein